VIKETVYFTNGKILVRNTYLAKAFQVTTRTVRSWDLEATPHDEGRFALYDLHEVIQWRKLNIKARKKKQEQYPHNENPYADMPDTAVPKEELEKRNEFQKLRKAKLQNAILEGEYVPVQDLDKTMATLAVMLMSSLKNHEKSAPAELANRASHEIQKLIKKAHYDLTDRLDRLLKKEFDCDETLYEVIGATLEVLDGDMSPLDIIKTIKA